MTLTQVTLAGVLALEEVAARGWPAPQTHRLGRWLLRAGDGWTRRANSVLVLGPPDTGLDEALTAVRRWYAERGLPAKLAVPLPLPAMDAELAGRGWRQDVLTDVLIRPVPAEPLGDHGVRLEPVPSPGWCATYRSRGALPPVARQIMCGPDTVTFASIVDGSPTDGGPVAATGRGVVIDGWLGIAAVEVLPGHRRRGLATRVTHALLGWGVRHGASRAYLQVETTNTAARALYTKLGFGYHHSYRVHQEPQS